MSASNDLLPCMRACTHFLTVVGTLHMIVNCYLSQGESENVLQEVKNLEVDISSTD